MQTENFNVMNVRCGGCATTIRDGLRDLPGVAGVEVDIGAGRVTVTGDSMQRAALAGTLQQLGYPEKS